ncbi:helix-turn-helix domain-containing protein [Aliarcobacter butzleri]|uniref:helix-turn-helix domain-containing protein n=1 Tax=Aliarcobacter butzleri TaxID=28197 RepID=UPI0021B3D10B|nr:helix-turn-helix transcriptional regulator [Aliarcobacter butzleri]MCT7561972.1 helix-turn-helix domain-containing protein [Aliarcobacter butzleri]
MNENESQLLTQLAEKIKSRRIQLNLSQEELAAKCGLDRTYISLVERSKRNPTYISLVKLSKGLEIDIRNLLGETIND